MFSFPFHSVSRRPALLFAGLLVSAVVAGGSLLDLLAREAPAQPAAPARLLAALGAEEASAEVTQMAGWVLASGDHRGAPFLIVDKSQARLFAFDGDGSLRASTAVLLGAAHSDGAEPAATPAGRFVADPADSGPQARLGWTNGRARLQLFGARTQLTPGRAEWRLASAESGDKRISDGSLHVPPQFFREHLHMLRNRPSVAYVLPETIQPLDLAHAPQRSTRSLL